MYVKNVHLSEIILGLKLKHVVYNSAVLLDNFT
jgi:hypothetical protein